MSRPRLLVFNQYYWPGVEATAHLLSELCAALAADFDVTVVTGKLQTEPERPKREHHEGVEIVRVSSTAFDRSSLPLRALNYATYLLGSLQTGLTAPPPDVVLCMTDPPVIADVALIVARRFDAPLGVVSQDVFPEIAIELHRLENKLVIEVLRGLIRLYLQRADRVVAIGDTMRSRLEGKGAIPERLRVIPNWVDSTALTPQPHENEWSREHGFEGRFIVMHSGNVGFAQNLDSLVRATTFLRDLDGLTVAVVGEGSRRAELVALAELLETDAVRFLPYQPRAALSESLSSASIHVVGLAKGLSGYVVPSRLYGILSVGRPVIVAADRDSETAQLVERVDCGVVVPPGRPELLAATIRKAYEGELPLEEMGKRAREYVIAEADRTVAIDRYRRLLAELQAEWRAA
jgi:glycosyltransferase involved in cell wall biosynthesis